MNINYKMKTVVEKYCPVVGHNVAVEVTGREETSSCLHAHTCTRERGGCTNRLFPGSQR